VIVATNHDLRKDVRAGKFRHDLYYRVNVLQIRAPALRLRGDDIQLLAELFIHKYNERNDCQVSDQISSDVMDQLKSYSWPGNVRELENVISRLANTLQDPSHLFSADLSSELEWAQRKPKQLRSLNVKSQLEPYSAIKHHNTKKDITLVRRESRCQKELDGYVRVLEMSNGNISEAARLLRIPRSTLQSRLSMLKSKCMAFQLSPSFSIE
jgi:transcriptional regulator with GAF, ATPase, and Fis domain